MDGEEVADSSIHTYEHSQILEHHYMVAKGLAKQK